MRVEVMFDGDPAQRRYCYEVKPPVAVGDRVSTPPNAWFDEEGEATVVSLTSTWTGTVSRARKL